MRLPNLLRSALMFGGFSAPLMERTRATRHLAPEIVAGSFAMVRESGPYRVTDRLRRWTTTSHFDDLQGARAYARAMDGTVWERYVGPTGTENWWSLDEA